MPCLPFSRRRQASNFALFLVCALWIQKESAHRLIAKRAVHQSCMDFPPPSLLLLGEARDAGYASRVKTSHTPPRQQWRGVVWLIVRGESSYHRCDSWELAGPLNHSRRKDLKGSTFSAQGSGASPAVAHAFGIQSSGCLRYRRSVASIQFVEDLRQTSSHAGPSSLLMYGTAIREELCVTWEQSPTRQSYSCRRVECISKGVT